MAHITFYEGQAPKKISTLEQIANDTLPAIMPTLVCATIMALPTIGANAIRGYYASQGTRIESEFLNSAILAGPTITQGILGFPIGAMSCMNPYMCGIKSRINKPIPGGIIGGFAYAYLAYLETGAGFELGYILGKKIV